MRNTICGSCIVIALSLQSQSPDSLLINGNDVIGEHMEHYEKMIEAGIDMSELSGILESRLEHPLNINSATIEDLEELELLSSIQIKNLIDYRNKYGMFYSIYELASIEGFSRTTIDKIIPFMRAGGQTNKNETGVKKRSSSHDIILRFQRKLAQQAGFIIPADSLQAKKTGSFYLGDANRYYLRYRYKSKKHISLGITAEKDPGEIFIKPVAGLDSSILNMLKPQQGFDFYSGYISYKNQGVIHSLILGDFHAQFGQGLTLWTGLSFSGGGDPAGFKRYAPMIKPNSSANESSFMRGIGVRLHKKHFDLALFYSRKASDASIKSNSDGDSPLISGLSETGYHRTLNEIIKKNNVIFQYIGGHLSFSNHRIRTGITLYKSMLELDLYPDEQGFNDFRFRGKENSNAGINFEALFKKTIIYGEGSVSASGGWALLAGITHNTPLGSILALQFREYRRNYQSILSGAYGIQSRNANERGVRLALEIPIAPKLISRLYSEYYKYPWLNYTMINGLNGMKNEISLDYIVQQHTKISLKYVSKKVLGKSSNNVNWIDQALYNDSQKVSIRIKHLLSSTFSMKSQFDHVMYTTEAMNNQDSRGSLLAFDLFYHPAAFPVRLSFRYALFNTDSYASRLYAYENDVLYATSMPAYYGIGFRTYILMKYEITGWLDSWIRFSLTNFTDRNIISSGTSEIIGNKSPEVKIQLRIKL